jgi:hypothetical protein
MGWVGGIATKWPMARGHAARRFLVAMMASGASPGLRTVQSSTYQGSMFGVHVHAVMHELNSNQWADVAVVGGIFGNRGFSGRAWREFGDHTRPDLATIRLDSTIEKHLRRYRVSVVSVDLVDTTERHGEALMLQLVLPMVGNQRRLLLRSTGSAEDRWCEL